MEKLGINNNGLIILIQESLLEYFQQPQIRLKHTLALAGRSPLVIDDSGSLFSGGSHGPWPTDNHNHNSHF
eukprot:scaffold168574_cov74-Cyclotella_meneghiniana.AAC.1